MDDSDILSFGHTGKVSFKAALQSVRRTRQQLPTKKPIDSSSQSSDYSDSDSSSHRGRKRAHKVGGKSGSLASKLIHNQLEPYVISSSDSDDSELDSKSRKKKVKKKTPSPSSSDISRSPSPEPSPPPIGQITTPTDQASKQALFKANNAIQQLILSSSYTPSDYSFSSDQNDSLLGSATKENFTLRVRYRGNIHRYNITKSDQLSVVCALLASEVGSRDNNKFLLSHKTSTLSEDDSPLTLGLTTADIIDAVLMSEPANKSGANSNSNTGIGSIKIKVQSSSKAITYSLSKADPLKKAMEAFATELNMPLSKLTFSFDGERISPKQTAVDLDMEDGDCIDAM